MFNKFKKIKRSKKGFTLIELLLVIPLISVVFIIAYNIILMSNKSFHSVGDDFSTYEDIRVFQINIQKEANQARKANENDDVMQSENNNEIYMYTDINGDRVPEKVRYRLEDKELKRDIKYPILELEDTKYPYEYDNKWSDEKIILKNVSELIIENHKLMRDQDETHNSQKSKDYRKKATLKIKVNIRERNSTIDQTIILVTKSRAEAD